MRLLEQVQFIDNFLQISCKAVKYHMFLDLDVVVFITPMQLNVVMKRNLVS